MFSKESARQADACRFCWMCRHICPVAGATGNEGWTPRARGLVISMIERGIPYDKELTEAMYHCTLCDACANDCATGFKPSEFIREARTLAVAEDIAPEAVMSCIEAIQEKGNIFGDARTELCFCELPEKADVLLYVGQSSRAVYAESAKSYAELLKKAGVSFTVLKDEKPSGAYMSELMGFTGDVQTMAKALADSIEETSAGTVVVLNPVDAAIMRDEYKKYGLLTNVEVVTATAFLAELVSNGALSFESCELEASLQEPVKLTRGLDEIEPLKQLIAAAGIKLNELFLNGKMSRCIGTVPFDLYSPGVVSEMVRVRCEDAIRLDSNKIITASPDDFYLMNKYAKGVEIIDLYKLLSGLC